MENGHSPFVHKFQADGFNYIYDVGSNDIYRVNDVVYAMIDHIFRDEPETLVAHLRRLFPEQEIRENLRLVMEAVETEKRFCGNRPQIRFDHTLDSVKSILDTRLNQLILEVTRRCNMRCRYCSYSGQYPLHRIHQDVDMPWTVARKALDHFMDRSAGIRGGKPFITFYGGEPLLRFDLIRQTVAYIRESGRWDEFRFSFTTNGTLLSAEVISFLVANDIHILVSLDGPSSLHDQYRVFRNGRGTFTAIWENLRRLREAHPDYCRSRVSFAATVTPPYPFRTIMDFYTDHELHAGEGRVTLTPVDPYQTTFFREYRLEEKARQLTTELDSLFARYVQALENGTYDELGVEKQVFDLEFHALAFRSATRLEDWLPPLGTCFPGQRRLLVDCGGTFYMCERVGCHQPLGDVDGGFDYRRVLEFLTEYQEFFQDCRECWAVRLCKKCFANVQAGARFSQERKELFCLFRKEEIERNLQAYCRLKQKNPRAFSPLTRLSVV